MSEKRRDNKGRLLKIGEVQRANGKYMYRYTDSSGIRRSINSWRLVETDKAPQGKRSVLPLRDLEKQIESSIVEGIDIYQANSITLNDAFEKYMAASKNLKEYSKLLYRSRYDTHVRSGLGLRKIGSIVYSDILLLYSDMAGEQKLSCATIQSLHSILHSVFRTAVRDNLLKSDPTSDAMREVKKRYSLENSHRFALTKTEQERLVSFLRTHPKYDRIFPIVTMLLGTGCRIGEVLGLRWCDCDFEKRVISINHTISGYTKDGTFRMRVNTPKTKKSIRTIPMLDDVYQMLCSEKLQREKDTDYEVDGYRGFIFYNRYGKLYYRENINDFLREIVREANAEGDILLPNFTAHNLRHTFCTRLCESGCNVKFIQSVMGHKNIQTTLNIYADVTKDLQVNELDRINGILCVR